MANVELYTTHYGIAKYGPQGKGKPMGVYDAYNPAMDTIDKILFDHKGLIDALEAALDALTQRVTNLESALDALEQRVTKIEGDISDIRSDISSIKNQLATVGSDLTSIKNRLTALEGAQSDLWTAIRNIVSHASGGGTVNQETGAISWGTSGALAVGNINITSGSGYIRCHAATNQTNDLKAV